MKKILFASFILGSFHAFSQDTTDIFVFDVENVYEGLQLTGFKKISNNDGYNNQPSFSTNETILFAGNNNGQSDISEYNLEKNTQRFINLKTDGGEYSPQQFPDNTNIAAVRLDIDSLQRLYSYDKSGSSSEIIPNLQVAYFAFYNKNIMLATVLDNEQMTLVKIDIQSKQTDTLFNNAGRSIHKIPNSDYMSFTVINEESNLDIFMMNMETDEAFFICQLPIGVQDYVWLSETQMLLGSENRLYLFDTLGPQKWLEVASLEEFSIQNITRLAVSPNGKKLALVGVEK